MTETNAYAELERRFARLTDLGDARAFLSWDTATMMPEGGAAARADQTATLSALYHELLTPPDMKDLLAAAEEEELDDWRRANLREMRREWAHAAAVPAALVESLSRASSACETIWREARPAADFARIAESLAEVVRLTREVAARKGEALGLAPYDALLDQYEPDARAAAIDALFADLAAFLPGFLAEALERQSPPPPRPAGPFPEARQRALGLEMMKRLGFDFAHGRLDVSRHPFSGGTADDTRITTRYDEDDFLRGLMGVLHETGHALYEQGLPAAWRRQPVGRARGMTLHESQSLLVEMQLCRSPAFFAFAAPRMAGAFDGAGAEWEAAALHAALVRVAPGFIRIDADEVTYPAHVILRYRLERALIANELAVRDLPAAWAEGMRTLLGLMPPDDASGCLQDIHWYEGAFGYFPTYTLGAMAAAQLFDAARRALPDLDGEIARGDFRPLLGWLRSNVHGLASLAGTDEILLRATGRPLEATRFKEHLRRRYLG